MAYAQANLLNVSGMPPGFAQYIYKSDTDTRATVAAVGYFNNDDDDLNLAADDVITVTGDQGGYELVVVSLSSGSVTSGVREIGNAPIAAGATLTLTRATHNGKTIALDTAAGSVITLPAATGTGMEFRFIVSVGVTANVHSIATASDSDEFQGHVYQVDTDTSDAIAAYPGIVADNFDLISMNGTTTGGLVGDWIELVDVVSGVWAIRMFTNGNGTVATPIA